MITAEQAREILHYDQDTGKFIWKVRTARQIKVGDYAGSLNGNGYLNISLFGRRYYAHRIAWMIMYGYWPIDQIDHINGIRSDNRWYNLRAASHKENGRNQKTNSRNTSGIIGVGWHKASGMWQAKIKVNGQNIHLGYFADINDASYARKVAEQKYGFHQNHGRHITS